MTNGDRIRRMTDEELAVMIICPGGADAPCNQGDDYDCCKCRYEWLREDEQG